jgi:hypothetical protein
MPAKGKEGAKPAAKQAAPAKTQTTSAPKSSAVIAVGLKKGHAVVKRTLAKKDHVSRCGIKCIIIIVVDEFK